MELRAGPRSSTPALGDHVPCPQVRSVPVNVCSAPSPSYFVPLPGIALSPVLLWIPEVLAALSHLFSVRTCHATVFSFPCTQQRDDEASLPLKGSPFPIQTGKAVLPLPGLQLTGTQALLRDTLGIPPCPLSLQLLVWPPLGRAKVTLGRGQGSGSDPRPHPASRASGW